MDNLRYFMYGCDEKDGHAKIHTARRKEDLSGAGSIRLLLAELPNFASLILDGALGKNMLSFFYDKCMYCGR